MAAKLGIQKLAPINGVCVGDTLLRPWTVWRPSMCDGRTECTALPARLGRQTQIGEG